MLKILKIFYRRKARGYHLFLFRCDSRPCWGFWGSFVCLAESWWVSGSRKFGWKLFPEETESSQPLICNRQQEEGRGRNSQNLLFWMIPTFFTQLKQAKWLCKTQKIMVCWLSLGMWNVFFWNVKCLTKKIKILSILISFSYVSKVWLTELAGFSY